jgi:hypothetical protein
MTSINSLLKTLRGLTRTQRRAALAALVVLCLLVPALPHVVVLVAAAVAVWAAAQPLLVGMALGAYGVRRRKAGAR